MFSLENVNMSVSQFSDFGIFPHHKYTMVRHSLLLEYDFLLRFRARFTSFPYTVLMVGTTDGLRQFETSRASTTSGGSSE
jgi:hypothetical protein